MVNLSQHEINIVAAPNAFKGYLTARRAASVIAEGIRGAAIEHTNLQLHVHEIPIADGGDGMLDVLAERVEELHTTGPFGQPIIAKWGTFRDSALIELAQAAGHQLQPARDLNPIVATTAGVGELLKAVIDKGFRKVYIGLGGSVTVDGGIGAMTALGAKVEYSGDRVISIDPSAMLDRLKGVEVSFLADVMCGVEGATRLFARQKCGPSDDVEETLRRLEVRLTSLNAALVAAGGANALEIPGTGASGAIAMGFASLCKFPMIYGGEFFVKTLGGDRIPTADLVITGEGSFDCQTVEGKGPLAVLQAARGVRAVIAGRVEAAAIAQVGAFSVELGPRGRVDPEGCLREASRGVWEHFLSVRTDLKLNSAQ